MKIHHQELLKYNTGEYFLRSQGDSYAHFVDGVYKGEFYITPIGLDDVVITGKKPRTYKLTDGDFWNVEPTSTAQTAEESLVKKITGGSATSWKNLFSKFNPKKSPVAVTPASMEVINDANTIRGAKERLITLGAGNSVIIDIYPSVLEGSANVSSYPVGYMKISYEGLGGENEYIFTETIVNIPYDNVL